MPYAGYPDRKPQSSSSIRFVKLEHEFNSYVEEPVRFSNDYNAWLEIDLDHCIDLGCQFYQLPDTQVITKCFVDPCTFIKAFKYPGTQLLRYSDSCVPKYPSIQVPEYVGAGHLGTWVLMYTLRTWVCRYLGTRLPRYPGPHDPGTRVARYPGSQVLRYPGSWECGYMGTLLSGYPGV